MGYLRFPCVGCASRLSGYGQGEGNLGGDHHIIYRRSAFSLDAETEKGNPGMMTSLAWVAPAAVTALRYRAIASLGEYRNTRVVVVPGTRLVRTGPYRFLRHPNYIVVASGGGVPR
jgi:isoprenylcysteine carboxyl methyltransferase (ICMT) family protein YpbQ